ncbi:60S ribosomal protein L38 [Ascosphaera pollenicola]|nr:60S ribosomal protein L38 [Ascosphaera pollenicola]
MLGDVNKFLTFNDDDQDNDDNDDSQGQSTPTENTRPPGVVGELELMIAERKNQNCGYGRSALLCFMHYVLQNEDTIVREFLKSRNYNPPPEIPQRLAFFCGKIGAANVGSIRLFESLGFKKIRDEPNFFGEFELRKSFNDNAHGIDEIAKLMHRAGQGILGVNE